MLFTGDKLFLKSVRIGDKELLTADYAPLFFE